MAVKVVFRRSGRRRDESRRNLMRRNVEGKKRRLIMRNAIIGVFLAREN